MILQVSGNVLLDHNQVNGVLLEEVAHVERALMSMNIQEDVLSGSIDLGQSHQDVIGRILLKSRMIFNIFDKF